MCCVYVTYSDVLALYDAQVHVAKPQYQEAVLLMVTLPSMLQKGNDLSLITVFHDA